MSGLGFQCAPAIRCLYTRRCILYMSCVARMRLGQQGSMRLFPTLVFGILPCLASAQVAITGRVVDETGAGVDGARVELRGGRQRGGRASSDRAGQLSELTLPAPANTASAPSGSAFISSRASRGQFEPGASELTVTLNHLQEFSDHIDVVYSPPAIDPAQPADRKELDNTEISAVPYPAPQDYRNALPMMDGVVQDNSGRAHFNGAQTSQTNYTLDGFNISDPVTGRLETRVNIETIQSMDVADAAASRPRTAAVRRACSI